MKKTYIFAILAAALAVSGVFYAFPEIKSNVSFLRPTPEYAASYSVISAFCSNQDEHCGVVQLTFAPSEKAVNEIPPYEIRETNENARVELVFHRVADINTNFTYLEVTSSEFIDNMDYYKMGDDFFLNVDRKGNLSSLEIKRNGNAIKIFFTGSDNENFVFSGQEPADKSIVYPSRQTIAVEAEAKSPIEKAIMYVEDSLVEPVLSDLGSNKFSISYAMALENDKQYKTRVIVIDSGGRAAVSTWEFAAQKTAKPARLEKDRFKYLGWWGRISSDSAGVFQEPTTQSKKVGTFSTINRVKVLEEVLGESVKRNNLWYKIDGGAHPGAYVFSGDVIPVVQPEPPARFTIPSIVREGEYWIDIDLTKKILTLFLYDKPVFATYVSPGRPSNPTLPGTYRIWYKLAKTRMRGGPPVVANPYDLPNVPYVMYYRGSYAVHGTYWHDKFGTQQSAGCTNLTQGDAEYIFDLVGPVAAEGKNSVFSSLDNAGTVVHNHY